jgi:predicted phosphodiesterase
LKTNRIFFCGDVHGNFPSVIQSVCVHRPAAVIFLGDLQAQRPLEQELKSILGLTEIWFIHGNHDTDSQADHDNLFLSALADRNLHGRVVEIAGTRIAGLGGVFRGEVWHPPGEIQHESFAALERSEAYRPAAKAYRTERARKHRSTIFPNDYCRLIDQRADILVTHEAPSCHPHGFEAIDELARSLRVHTTFHGHQHDRLDYRDQRERLGFMPYGVGFCGITDQDGNVICEGDFDKQNELRYQQYRQKGRAV